MHGFYGWLRGRGQTFEDIETVENKRRIPLLNTSFLLIFLLIFFSSLLPNIAVTIASHSCFGCSPASTLCSIYGTSGTDMTSFGYME